MYAHWVGWPSLKWPGGSGVLPGRSGPGDRRQQGTRRGCCGHTDKPETPRLLIANSNLRVVPVGLEPAAGRYRPTIGARPVGEGEAAVRTERLGSGQSIRVLSRMSSIKSLT